MQGESDKEVAERMRLIAAGVSDLTDARAILRYADWLECKVAVEESVRTSGEIMPAEVRDSKSSARERAGAQTIVGDNHRLHPT